MRSTTHYVTGLHQGRCSAVHLHSAPLQQVARLYGTFLQHDRQVGRSEGKCAPASGWSNVSWSLNSSIRKNSALYLSNQGVLFATSPAPQTTGITFWGARSDPLSCPGILV